MVVGIFKAGLQGVVIDIGYGQFRLDPRYSHSLKLQIGHGSRGILRKSLIYAESHLLSRLHLSAD